MNKFLRIRNISSIISILLLQLTLTTLCLWIYSGKGIEKLSENSSRLLLSLEYTGSDGFDPLDKRRKLSYREGLLDKYRSFSTLPFAFVSSKWNELSSSKKVCLGAQSSVDRLGWLVHLNKAWSGPLSISLFTPGLEFGLANAFIHSYLLRCWPSLGEKVSFHITFPVNHPLTETESFEMESHLSNETCDENLASSILNNLLSSYRTSENKRWREELEYPQNLLRNIAKAGCQTPYTFIPDIDMIPFPGLDSQLEIFLSNSSSEIIDSCEKCAFVVPTYEIDSDSSRSPLNKSELLEYIISQKARQFHKYIYSINQKSSKLDLWESIPQSSQLDIAYKVDNYIFQYEPVYISKASVPIFDERFIGFGMTRNTQVYEMYVAGWEFYVLNNAFLNHWGFQNISSRPPWRAKQQEKNNGKFDEFAKEISARYGRDPLNMMSKLKKYNYKNVKVAYTKNVKNKKKKE